MGRHASTALGSRCHLRGPASIRAMSKHPPVNAHESTRQCGSTSPNVGRGLTGKVPCSAVRRCKRSPVNADASARQCGSTSPNVGRAVPAGPRVQPCDGASGHRSTLMRRHGSTSPNVGRGLTGEVPRSAVRWASIRRFNADASTRQCGSTSPNVGRGLTGEVPRSPVRWASIRRFNAEGTRGAVSSLCVLRVPSLAAPTPTINPPMVGRTHRCSTSRSSQRSYRR
jgi:hypothetical protein